MQQSKTWRTFRDDCMVRHLIRCHEVTFGENGWHPHTHVLLFALFPHDVMTWQDRLSALWMHFVRDELGDKHVPSAEHGLDLSTCDDGSYIAKMGLEVSGATTKQGREGHLSSWQVAREVVDGRMSTERWREYAEGMNGCHQLQWSRGLREAFGEPAEESSFCPDNEFCESSAIADIPRETWRAMSRERGALGELRRFGRTFDGSGEESRAWLLSFFERFGGGAEAQWRWVQGRAKLRWCGDQNP
jgi:hypothetical protein